MATNFPGSVDDFTNPSAGNTLDSPSHSAQHTNINDAVEAVEGFLLNTYQPSFRNIIINGDMQVAQRNTSVTGITTNNYYTVDRFRLNPGSLGTWTMSVENDAPTGSGFRKSTKVLCTTADASPAAGDYLSFNQPIEGQNLQQIAKGTASAKELTLSFWVKANVTGTYIVDIYDNDNTRVVSKSYTISASATWEKKTITFPADTTGALDNDNAVSFYLEWWLAAGSNYTTGTLATSWQSYTAANVAVGQTNLASATNNYWQITGVQLEVGSTATPFEFLPAQTELALCQRYYYSFVSGNALAIGVGALYSATALYTFVNFPVTMRIAPNLVASSGTNYYSFDRNSGSDTFNSFTIANASTTSSFIYNNSEISGTSGQAGIVFTNNASASVAFNSEL